MSFTSENPPILPILTEYGTRRDFYHLTESEGLTRLQVGLQLFEKNGRTLYAFMRKQFFSWGIPTSVLTIPQLKLFTALATNPEQFDAYQLPDHPLITGLGNLRKAIHLGPNEYFTHQQYALLHATTASLLCPYWIAPANIVTLPISTVKQLSELL